MHLAINHILSIIVNKFAHELLLLAHYTRRQYVRDT